MGQDLPVGGLRCRVIAQELNSFVLGRGAKGQQSLSGQQVSSETLFETPVRLRERDM